MKKNKILITITLLFFLLAVFFIKNIFFIGDNNLLFIHYIDIGQGDSILIKTPQNKNILVDSGDNKAEDKLASYLALNNVKKLNMIIATHPDTDHIGGLDMVVNDFKVDNFFMPDIKSDSKNYNRLLDALDNKKLTPKPLYQGDTINIDTDIILQIISPIKDKVYENNNEFSIAFRLIYKNSSFLFMADSEKENENDILSENINVQSDVIKLGHHGSKTSSSMEFLNSVNPKLAIISSGKDNKFNHPHKEVIDILNELEIPYLDTKDKGDIVIKSDGEKIILSENKKSILKTLDDFIKSFIKL